MVAAHNAVIYIYLSLIRLFNKEYVHCNMNNVLKISVSLFYKIFCRLSVFQGRPAIFPCSRCPPSSDCYNRYNTFYCISWRRKLRHAV